MAPITNELAGEHHSSSEVLPPMGEAAALVARLLSESDQPADVDAQTSVSSPPSEPAPVIAELFATQLPSLNSPGDRKERAVLSLEGARPLLPYSKIGVVFIIVVLAVLIFGAGLAVGHGILVRRSAQVGKSPAQAGTPPAVQYNATSKAIHNAVNLPSTASALPQSPAVPLSRTNSSAEAGTHTAISSDSDTDHNPQALAAEARNVQAAPTHALSTPPRVTNDSSASARTVASIPSGSPQADRQAAPAGQPAYTQSFDPSASDGATHALTSSAQPAHPEGGGIVAGRFENAPHATSATQAAETTAPSEVAGDAPETQVLPGGPPGASAGATVESPGHIESSQVIHSVQPVYPLTAKQLHVEGDVELRVVVGVDGTVRSVGLVSGPPSLVMAAIDAARQFLYKPALLNGKAIETVQTIEMSFKLKD